MVKKGVVVPIIFFLCFTGFIPVIDGGADVTTSIVIHSHDWQWPDQYDVYIDESTNIAYVKEDIRKAVNLVSSSGIVYITDTDTYYDIGRNSIELDKPISIIGYNKTRTIVESASTSHCVFSIESDGITIKNLTISGACYPADEDNPIQAGVIIYEYEDTDETDEDIILENNIIKENSNGVTIIAYNKKPHAISINDNIICDNKLNGVIVDSGCAKIIDNNISNNKNAGINLWGGECGNDIRSNHLFSNRYGIWNDQGLFNTFSYNLIENNTIGISFWSKEQKSKCCENTIHSNHIRRNEHCGMILGYLTQNSIYNNTFEENGDCGLNVLVGCDDNTIYHNNFINNGRHYIGKKKCANAADNLRGNKWYNISTEEGNYWCDYRNRTRNDLPLDADDYRGVWNDVTRDATYQLPYFVKIYLLGINLYFDFIPTAEDNFPFVRKSGWNPQAPTIIDYQKELVEQGEKIRFRFKVEDINDDGIKFVYHFSDESHEPLTPSLFIDSNLYECIKSYCWSDWYELGIPDDSVFLEIKALDVRECCHNEKKGFDGHCLMSLAIDE